MRLGFIGTGTITSAIVNGLMEFGPSDVTIMVSPRNAELAQSLSERHARVTVASNNQAVIEGSDTVVLAVRPQIAREALAGLRFRADQEVISLVATISLHEVATLVAPAGRVSVAAPLPPVEAGRGATAMLPASDVGRALFGPLGVVVEARSQDEFGTLLSATAIMGSYFGLLQHIVGWMEQQGVDSLVARRYVTQILLGLAFAGKDSSHQDMSHMRQEYSTRGGLNEQFYTVLEQAGVLKAVTLALDTIQTRIRGA